MPDEVPDSSGSELTILVICLFLLWKNLHRDSGPAPQKFIDWKWRRKKTVKSKKHFFEKFFQKGFLADLDSNLHTCNVYNVTITVLKQLQLAYETLVRNYYTTVTRTVPVPINFSIFKKQYFCLVSIWMWVK